MRDQPLQYRGKRDALVDQLTEAILRGELPVGQWLRQEDVAEQFGVSPTPVREALRVLEARGMVKYEPHRGVRVADFSGSAPQFYKLREALECLAAGMAVERMGPPEAARIAQAVDRMELAVKAGDQVLIGQAHREFHLLLYSACEFPALLEMIEMVWAKFPWDALLTLPERRPISVAEHRRIARIVAAGEPEAAAEALRQHLRRVSRALSALPAHPATEATTGRRRGR